MSRLLHSALDAINTQQYQSALNILNKSTQHSADWYLLLALSYAGLSKFTEAENTYLRAFKDYAGHIPLLENYTNLLCRQHKYAQCITFFNTLPKTINSEKVHLNVIESLLNTEQLLQAEKRLADPPSAAPLLPRYQWLKLDLYERLGNLDKVDQYIDSLPVETKQQFFFQYKRACNLRSMGKFTEALTVLLALQQQSQQHNAELNFIIGCTYYDLMQFAAAERYLKQCLQLAPNYVPAHECLNKLYWEQSNAAALMSSYQVTLARYPANPTLVHSQLGQLLQINDLDNALHVATQATKQFPDNLDIKHAHSIILAKHGNDEEAFSVLMDIVKLAPQSARYSIDLANYCIHNNDYQAAIAYLQNTLKFNPFNQEIWAYLSTAWRLSGNDQYHWLTNYQQFVKVMELPTPKGFGSFAAFNTELKQLLLGMHTKQQQPLDQSVRSGSQTDGHLLYRSNHLLSLFKQSMESCIYRYLGDLPTDPTHPLTARNQQQFMTRGSWSVKLEQGGYHANHIHPQGWLSAPSYISTPHEMNNQDKTKSGWLKLGETSLGLGERESIAREICPEEGQIIIFPSYIWHGTNKLTSNQPRLTIPCDITPLR
ncbi:2OG-Fe(II) oxygenase family protein [Pseudoalteromonas mariniglutinosa]|uniref:2OG-Fe(II) oxygenase family protein n=1 Tax=Pseudoalteromonas mariniglutinosa TaxID=206042 RepID=UPI00384EC416